MLPKALIVIACILYIVASRIRPFILILLYLYYCYTYIIEAITFSICRYPVMALWPYSPPRLFAVAMAVVIAKTVTYYYCGIAGIVNSRNRSCLGGPSSY